ncbi:hypothetical protein [Methanobacterium sp. BAmetb5]|uniref:hypothetical protein n=1 Tax=Methanobacterium sp. BAmetb5 TaxID=2025351 RepID=UPI0025D69FCA|nr:hypothetical protein [Methanobacterium sp. BAmetb5]
MTSNKQQEQIPSPSMSKGSEPTLEIVILLVFGVFLFILGLLWFKIQSGELPYNSNGTYGLLLVIFSLEIITLGRSPFGDFRRSWTLIILGASMAVLGTVACLIPGLMEGFIRELVGIFIFAGGIVSFLQLVVGKDQARMWIQTSSIHKHLALALGLLYFIEVLVGLVTLLPGITTHFQTTVLYIIFGISFFYLAWCLQKVPKLDSPGEITSSPSEPSATQTDQKSSFFLFQNANISTNIVLTFMSGLIVTLVAILLIPTGMGIFTFSFDSMYGLLMVMLALQVMALGNTPVGQFKLSWLLIIIGLTFISMGIVSCIVPGLLTNIMIILLAIWNLITGSVGLFKIGLPILDGIRHPPAEPTPIPPMMKKMLITGILLQIVLIIFGINNLLPFVPDMALLGILFIMGILQINMARILQNPLVQHMNL